jgi:hypothetical protein
MNYRITCTQKAQTPGTAHTHIVMVGTGDDTGWSLKWTVDEVVVAIRQGIHTFYTQSRSTGRIARVIAEWCPTCNRWIITTQADAISDNNLNNLPTCSS